MFLNYIRNYHYHKITYSAVILATITRLRFFKLKFFICCGCMYINIYMYDRYLCTQFTQIPFLNTSTNLGGQRRVRFVEKRPKLWFGSLPRGERPGQVLFLVAKHPGHFFLVWFLRVDVQFVEDGECCLKNRNNNLTISKLTITR